KVAGNLMESKHGKHTGEFGRWLTDYFRSIDPLQKYSVFYDHGNKEKELNVSAIKGFYSSDQGHQVTNINRLADIDVMVVDNNKVLLLIEIEESGMPPKKILGDIFGALFCNEFAVRKDSEQVYFTPNRETRLVVAGITPSQGGGQGKIETVIMPRVQQFSIPGDTIQTKNVNIIFGGNISEMLDKLKIEIKEIFPGERI
ncbi:MAG: hypothetical protein JW963_23940, partial [Anaerolineales bacterium]|nr:hypothetical protein [Anaerolineales bacterium]